MNNCFRAFGTISVVASSLSQLFTGASLQNIYGMAYGCGCLLIALTIFPKETASRE